MQQNIAIQQALCIVFMLNFDQNGMKHNAEIELTKNRLIMCFTKQLTVFWDRGTLILLCLRLNHCFVLESSLPNPLGNLPVLDSQLKYLPAWRI